MSYFLVPLGSEKLINAIQDTSNEILKMKVFFKKLKAFEVAVVKNELLYFLLLLRVLACLNL